MNVYYPFIEEQSQDGYRVQAVDMPEISATGSNAAETAAAAKAAFVEALPGYVAENGTLPEPTPLNENRHTFVLTLPRASLVALLDGEQLPQWLEGKGW